MAGDGGALALEETTHAERAKAAMPSMLDEAALASKHACALSAYGLSSDQIQRLEAFATFSRNAYQKLQHMLMKKDPCEAQICDIMK